MSPFDLFLLAVIFILAGVLFRQRKPEPEKPGIIVKWTIGPVSLRGGLK